MLGRKETMNINPKKQDILKKFFRNECSEKEIEQLSHWMNDENEQAEIVYLMDEMWQKAKRLSENIDIDSKKLFNQIQQEIDRLENKPEHRQSHIRHYLLNDKNVFRKMAKIAAVFLLPALLLTAGYYLVNHHSQNKIAFNTVIVPNGQKKVITLSDGTRVWVNSGSTFRYPQTFKGKNREVQLTGEAFFDVTHNQKHPFIVSTNEVNIKVLGTAFNVSAYPDGHSITTTLVRGRVVAYRKSASETLGNRVFLFPGQEAKYSSAEHRFTVSTVNTRNTGSWKSGNLMFNNTPLTEVVKKLNRWYNVNIQIQDTTIEMYLYSVSFKNKPLETVEEILSEITPIKFVKSGSQFLVVKDKKRLKEFINLN